MSKFGMSIERILDFSLCRRWIWDQCRIPCLNPPLIVRSQPRKEFPPRRPGWQTQRNVSTSFSEVHHVLVLHSPRSPHRHRDMDHSIFRKSRHRTLISHTIPTKQLHRRQQHRLIPIQPPSSQLLLGILTIGPWLILIVYDLVLYIARAATYEIPYFGGRARGRQKPRAPTLAERPSGRARTFSIGTAVISGSEGEEKVPLRRRRMSDGGVPSELGHRDEWNNDEGGIFLLEEQFRLLIMDDWF
jgi:hypothetical protein